MKVRCPYKCDYCLNPKGETNHWWLRPRDVKQFILLAWNDLRADQDEHEHICSESCAAKALSRWMNRTSPEFTTMPAAMVGPIAEVAKRPN
jgi:hypothetical protein